jgi:putative restriction endonuclease
VARLSKPQLLQKVEEAFRSGGWNVLFLPSDAAHPARYRIYRDDTSLTVRVYIWNITHGGGAARAAGEYRIQVTGLPNNRFEPEIGGKTLILGWWDNEEIFAGFDYRRHAGQFGASPSLQIGLPALQAAIANRFAVHAKDNGELAIAFKPDFLGAYAENLESLHDTGQAPQEVEVLTQIAATPAQPHADQIQQQIAEPRRWAVTQTRRALRALDFGDRVLSAYKHRCAMCGIQLELLDGAHILPVADPESTDETCNGVALCTLHHRAYDRSLVTFGADYRIHLSNKRIQELRDANRHGGLPAFRHGLRDIIALPAEAGSRPRPQFVQKANMLRGWLL